MNQDIIKTHCETINKLSEEQALYPPESENWIKLEKQLVEIECKLFNNLVLMELNEINYLFEQVPIIPLLAVHLAKYYNNDTYKDELSILDEQSKILINLIRRQLYIAAITNNLN